MISNMIKQLGYTCSVTIPATVEEGSIIIHDGETGDINTPTGAVGERVGILIDKDSGIVALTGVFNLNKIIFNGNDTYQSVGGALQNAGIFLENWGV